MRRRGRASRREGVHQMSQMNGLSDEHYPKLLRARITKLHCSPSGAERSLSAVVHVRSVMCLEGFFLTLPTDCSQGSELNQATSSFGRASRRRWKVEDVARAIAALRANPQPHRQESSPDRSAVRNMHISLRRSIRRAVARLTYRHPRSSHGGRTTQPACLFTYETTWAAFGLSAIARGARAGCRTSAHLTGQGPPSVQASSSKEFGGIYRIGKSA